MGYDSRKIKVSGNYQKKVRLLIAVLWTATVFCVLVAICCLPNFYAVIPLMMGLVLLPIVKWQRLLKKVFIRKWIKPTVLCVLLLGLLFCIFYKPVFEFVNPVPVSDLTSTLEVHFLDVGEGDATLVLCENKAMLIDGGSASYSSFIYSYLKRHGVTHLDYIICTHPHEDHVGGLAGALNYVTVDKAFCSVLDYETRAFQSFVKYLAKQNVSLEVPENATSIFLGPLTIQFYNPAIASNSINNNSIVIKLIYGDTSFLFMADAEREEEYDLVRSSMDLRSDLLRVGHHGSNSSSGKEFLKNVKPDIAVISVGKDNAYGHPADEVLKRLADVGADIYRTDIMGEIICISDGKNITVSTEH